MRSTDGGGSQPNLMDLVAGVVAASTGHSKRYQRTWEEELGDSAEAKAAAEAWRAWGIERPGALLRKEWFGGAPARMFDWKSPPDPAIGQRYGFTYDEFTQWAWSGFKFTDDEFIDVWRDAGLMADEAAHLLNVARRLSRGGGFNAGRLAATAKVFKELGVALSPAQVWVLQNANQGQITKIRERFIGLRRVNYRRHEKLVAFYLYRKVIVWVASRRV
jgi:hypothetical protein